MRFQPTGWLPSSHARFLFSFLLYLSAFLSCRLIAVSCFSHDQQTGDDQYGNIPGVFYAFGQTGLTIFDPSTMLILKHLPQVNATSFGDAVYLRDQAQLKHYVFAANADTPGIVYMLHDQRVCDCP